MGLWMCAETPDINGGCDNGQPLHSPKIAVKRPSRREADRHDTSCLSRLGSQRAVELAHHGSGQTLAKAAARLLRCRTGAHADTVIRHGKEVSVASFRNSTFMAPLRSFGNAYLNAFVSSSFRMSPTGTARS